MPRASWEYLLLTIIIILQTLHLVLIHKNIKLRTQPPPLLTQQLQSYQRKKRKIALLHVGKTGGTTVKQMLYLFQSCEPIPPYETKRQIRQRINRCKRQQGPSSALTLKNNFHPPIYKLVTGIYHEIPINLQNYTSVLITVRHPLDRVISAYLYSNPKNYKVKTEPESIYKCFNLPDEFFTRGLRRIRPSYDSLELQRCKILAQNVIQGKVKAGVGHLFHNYEYYIEKLKQKEVFVLRTEQFWKDWYGINSLLDYNSNYEYATIPPKNHYEKRSQKVKNRTVSNVGIQNACRYLCREIQIYKMILWKAVNLNDEDVLESLISLNETCPIEVTLDECAELKNAK